MRPKRRLSDDVIDPADTSPLNVAIAADRRDIPRMVRQAVETSNVLLAFQPVVEAGRNGKVAFYEGLIRLIDDRGRIIPAAEFIDSVETTEIGRKIDCLALEMGLDCLAEEPALRLSVNMSARSIGYPDWTRTLERGLALCPDAGDRLILEITESSAIVVPDLVRSFMGNYQRRGVSFALDDFGSGYTSFRYLRELLFDIIKIDGQFIRGIAQNTDNVVLTQALISVARHFDMFTVAESVETHADAQRLVEIGIDCMQGYYFGAPTVVPPWRPADVRATA